VAALLTAGAASPTLSAQVPTDRLSVALMTMGPGAEVYNRFGHNAIWIRDTVAGVDLVYNYGTYDFNEPGFVSRFVLGRPRYILAVSTLEATLQAYAGERRTVEVQELALRPEQEAELAFLLQQNALPENRQYSYDYYFDNCSTRIRDLLDQVLGGALRVATEGMPGEGTLRFHTQRMVANDPLMYLGILAAMGPAADRPLDAWGEMFLPEKVQQRLRELRVTDAEGIDVPLVAREATLLSHDEHSVLAAPPDWSLPLAGVGLALALVILVGMREDHIGWAGRIVGGLWALVAGVAGTLLAVLWFLTDHVMTTGNRNLLILSPLALVLTVLLWRRRIVQDRLTFRLGRVVVALAALTLIGALLALAPSLGGQVNREIAALAVPPTLAGCWLVLRVSRRRAVVLLPGR
jgi:hypothetical protein